MQLIKESDRDIPITGEYDVIVAGGGIAGVSAALSAARNGARVLLIDKQCLLGGLATSGLVTIYLPLCDGMGHQVSFGIAEELFRLSMSHHVEARYPKPWMENGTKEEKIKTRFEVQFNPTFFALELEKILLDSGVKILYDTVVCNVTTENDSIISLIVENKSGRQAYLAKSVVDATGDADICYFAGADTALFTPQNVLAAWNYALKNGEIVLNMLGYSESTQGENSPLSSTRFSGIKGEEISKMLCLSHEQILRHYESSRIKDKSYLPLRIATMPQLRMTRRGVGPYELRESDMHKPFADSIGMISDWRKPGPIYEIPFRSLYSNRIKNLICAGRCISVTDDMWDISRVIPACAVTGEAAGLAASMSQDFSALSIVSLQEKLTKNGVVLHEDKIKQEI